MRLASTRLPNGSQVIRVRAFLRRRQANVNAMLIDYIPFHNLLVNGDLSQARRVTRLNLPQAHAISDGDRAMTIGNSLMNRLQSFEILPGKS